MIWLARDVDGEVFYSREIEKLQQIVGEFRSDPDVKNMAYLRQLRKKKN